MKSLSCFLFLIVFDVFSANTEEAFSNPVPPRPLPRTADPKALEVITSYLQARGEREAFRAIEDRFDKIKVVGYGKNKPLNLLIKRYIKHPCMVRDEYIFDEKVEDKQVWVAYIYNGIYGWEYIMGSYSPLDKNQVCRLTHDKFLDDFFFHWKQDGYSLVYRGEEDVDKKPCHVIDVFHVIGNRNDQYYFCKENNLLLKKQWQHRTKDSKVVCEVFYRDWRKVRIFDFQPILYPHKEDEFRAGKLLWEREYLDIETNSFLRDTLFTMRAGYIPPPPRNNKDSNNSEQGYKRKSPPWLKKR